MALVGANNIERNLKRSISSDKELEAVLAQTTESKEAITAEMDTIIVDNIKEYSFLLWKCIKATVVALILFNTCWLQSCAQLRVAQQVDAGCKRPRPPPQEEPHMMHREDTTQVANRLDAQPAHRPDDIR